MQRLLRTVWETKKLPAQLKLEFYKAYADGQKPNNKTLEGVACNNVGSILMNEIKDDKAALPYFERAVVCGRLEHTSNPDTGSDESERLDIYLDNLTSCRENIKAVS